MEKELINLNSKDEHIIDYILSKSQNSLEEEEKNELIIEILHKTKSKSKNKKFESFQDTINKWMKNKKKVSIKDELKKLPKDILNIFQVICMIYFYLEKNIEKIMKGKKLKIKYITKNKIQNLFHREIDCIGCLNKIQ